MVFLGVPILLKMSLLCATTRNLRFLFAESACSDTGWLGGPRGGSVSLVFCVLELCRLVVSSGNLIFLFFQLVPDFAASMTVFSEFSHCRCIEVPASLLDTRDEKFPATRYLDS